jgi:hypothetical protein
VLNAAIVHPSERDRKKEEIKRERERERERERLPRKGLMQKVMEMPKEMKARVRRLLRSH